jgi:asparagine synthetase B (glutamine-hydrolysing)
MSSNEQFPLPVETETYIVCYNGEIYAKENSLDLQGEVEKLIEGIRARKLPDGMYAFSALDKKNKTLYLGRDEFGIKPLYYYHDLAENRFLYSSEIPPILEMLGPLRADKEAISEILCTGTTLDYKTPFSGIRILPPGTLLKVQSKSGRISLESSKVDFSNSNDDETLDTLLKGSVESCLETFRNVGLLISGGLDSNVLCSYLPEDTKKFHVAVDGNHDYPIAKNVFVSKLDEAGFWETLDKAILNFASPTRMSSVLMYQKLAELVAEHDYKCVLLGEGADEIFLGYPRHQEMFSKNFDFSAEHLKYLYFGETMSIGALINFNEFTRIQLRVNDLFSDINIGNIESRLFGIDLQFSLEPLLRRADHLLMSKTIEGRLPFLHNSIPEIGIKLGKENFVKGQQKGLLTNLIKQRVPNYEVRTKKHFRVPFGEWSTVENQMRLYAIENLFVLRNLGLENITRSNVESLTGGQLFTIVTIVMWYRKFKNFLL